MAISLYDLSVTSFLQVLGGVEGFLAKGLAHCKEKGLDPNEIVETKLFPDMAPFRFQIVSAAHHSAGGVKGAILGTVIGGGGITAATEGKEVELPQGSVLRVRLDSPVQIQTAAR